MIRLLKEFTTDSKSFMSYERMSLKGRIGFWIRYPYSLAVYIKVLYVDPRILNLVRD
jgi:hypothetical protein